MSARDALRILARRWLTCLLAFLVALGGFYYWSRTRVEEPLYVVRAHVLVREYPPLPARPQSTWQLTAPQTAPKAWLPILQGHRVRNDAYRNLESDADLARLGYAIQPVDIELVQVDFDESLNLLRVNSTHRFPEVAARIANVYAAAAERIGRDEANTLVDRSIELLGQDLADLTRRAQEADRLLETRLIELRRMLRADDPLEEVDRRRALRRDLADQINELKRRRDVDAHRLRALERDLVAAAALNREGLSDYPSVRFQAIASPEVEIIRKELETLFQQRAGYLKTRTEEHPAVTKNDEQIRDARSRLQNVRFSTVEKEIERRYVELRVDQETREIEIGVLLTAHLQASLREEITAAHADAVRHRDERARLQADVVETQRMIDQTRRLRSDVGYLYLFEPATAEGAQAQPTTPPASWALALLIAVMTAVAAAYVAELLDTRIRTDADVRRHMHYSVSAIVPELPREAFERIVLAEATPASELFDRIATLMRGSEEEPGPRRLVVGSAHHAEGKSTFTVQIGAALVRQGRRVILVDADLRLPTLHKQLNVPMQPGLADLIAADAVADAGRLRETIRQTELAGLDILTAGTKPELTYGLLNRKPLEALSDTLLKTYDIVLMDSPPLLKTGDGVKLAAAAERVVLLIGSGRVDKREAVWVKHFLGRVHPHEPWIILNRVPKGDAGGYSYYYYYYNSYDYRRPA